MRCAVDAAALRAEPRDDAEQVTQALRGDPLAVEEQRDGWARVETAYGYPGWIRTDELCGDLPLDLARTFLGTPYAWGGLTAHGNRLLGARASRLPARGQDGAAGFVAAGRGRCRDAGSAAGRSRDLRRPGRSRRVLGR